MSVQDKLHAVRQQMARLIRLASQPEQVAGGVALGAFISFAFPPGVQIVVALAIAPLLRVNPVAAATSVWITNPITIPIIYPFALWLGSMLTGLPVFAVLPGEDEAIIAWLTDFRAHGRAIILLYIGLLFLGSVCALVGYVGTITALRIHLKRRDARRTAKAIARAAAESVPVPVAAQDSDDDAEKAPRDTQGNDVSPERGKVPESGHDGSPISPTQKEE